MSSYIFQYGAAAVLILLGLGSLISGKPLGFKTTYYTEESLKRYARPSGVTSTLLGVLLILQTLGFTGKIPAMVGNISLVLLLIVCVIHFILVKKVLVKK